MFFNQLHKDWKSSISKNKQLSSAISGDSSTIWAYIFGLNIFYFKRKLISQGKYATSALSKYIFSSLDNRYYIIYKDVRITSLSTVNPLMLPIQ